MEFSFSRDELVRNLSDGGLFPPEEAAAAVRSHTSSPDDSGDTVARRLVAAGKLTSFQAQAVRERRLDELAIGSYQVLDRLGAGGMGTVYKARHPRMKRVVAIKVLSRAIAESEQFVQRFQREVEAVARLSHPNIVMAYDAGEAAVGHFLVMEFVSGRDLASEVQRRGPLPVAEAVDCIIQSARALEYAHGQGIIHRDIKPANLLRDEHGVVKVADLGLARFNDAAGRSADGAGLTQAGTVMGTAEYMPPEQAMGVTDIDHRADIYSLGYTLYYLLTGRPPYDGPTLMAVLLKHRDAPVASARAERPDVPPALDAVIQRMAAKAPDDRFASMAEVCRALEAVAVGPPAPARPAQLAATGVFTPAATVALAPTVAGPGLARPHEPRAAPPPARAATALLVEPSRSQAVIIRGYLQKLGFAELPAARSGQEALDVARKAPPQAVVSSMHLPDMTGVELAGRLRALEHCSGTGFVVITSQEGLAEEAGADVVHLAKPFTQEQLAAALAAAAAPRKPTRRVLLADDSAAARAHIRGVLTGLGIKDIVEAADGAAAVAALEAERFDLVVTDYNMPRLDGRGLVEYIRRRSPNPAVPVIMVTTETDPAKLEAVRQLGVGAICDKSFRADAVRGILERLG